MSSESETPVRAAKVMYALTSQICPKFSFIVVATMRKGVRNYFSVIGLLIDHSSTEFSLLCQILLGPGMQQTGSYMDLRGTRNDGRFM